MSSSFTAQRSREQARGFTLIELMISMLLGLVIVGSVMGVMLANKATYRTNEGLSQVQESARTAYELLAHDIRQADSNGCAGGARPDPSMTPRTANVLTAAAPPWWQNWFGMTGYDQTQAGPADATVAIGAGIGQRVAGTDSIMVESLDGRGYSVSLHTIATRRLDASNVPASGFVLGDIMLVCDFDHATIFRASSVSTAGGVVSVFHNAGGALTPNNCSRGLGFPTSCADITGNTYQFPRNSQMGRLVVTYWYIGNNGRAAEGGRSLFRRRLGAGGVLVAPEEIVAGVTDMQMQFRANADDDIIDNASLVPDWSAISSVLIAITTQSGDVSVTTDNALNSGRVERTFNYLVSLRNRLP